MTPLPSRLAPGAPVYKSDSCFRLQTKVSVAPAPQAAKPVGAGAETRLGARRGPGVRPPPGVAGASRRTRGGGRRPGDAGGKGIMPGSAAWPWQAAGAEPGDKTPLAPVSR